MMRRFAVVVLMVAAAGCGTDRSGEVVCDRVCDCLSVLPSERRSCVASCVDDFANRDVPVECVTCVEAATCSDLERGQCGATCAAPVPAGHIASGSTADSFRLEMP
jgi:hypothetical protein